MNRDTGLGKHSYMSLTTYNIVQFTQNKNKLQTPSTDTLEE